MNPQARTAQLLTQEVGGELVVYDLDQQQAHRLNRTAALIWQNCDGHTSITQLAALLSLRLNLPAEAGLVEDALSQLERARLLTDRMGLSRGQRVVLAGALALLVPMVESLVAPTPAAAYSW